VFGSINPFVDFSKTQDLSPSLYTSPLSPTVENFMSSQVGLGTPLVAPLFCNLGLEIISRIEPLSNSDLEAPLASFAIGTTLAKTDIPTHSAILEISSLPTETPPLKSNTPKIPTSLKRKSPFLNTQSSTEQSQGSLVDTLYIDLDSVIDVLKLGDQYYWRSKRIKKSLVVYSGFVSNQQNDFFFFFFFVFPSSLSCEDDSMFEEVGIKKPSP
jgi:hypothetical protein